MGSLPEHGLGELRSPAQALADLVDKFNCMARNHPELPVLARMIRELAEEIIQRKGGQMLREARAPARDTGLGLC